MLVTDADADAVPVVLSLDDRVTDGDPVADDVAAAVTDDVPVAVMEPLAVAVAESVAL